MNLTEFLKQIAKDFESMSVSDQIRVAETLSNIAVGDESFEE